MANHKTFRLAAVVTLALGIDASTAIISVVYGVLLRPLPFFDPDWAVPEQTLLVTLSEQKTVASRERHH